MTEPSDPKKRARKKKGESSSPSEPLQDDAVIQDDAAPPSDPTLSDRGTTEAVAARMREMSEEVAAANLDAAALDANAAAEPEGESTAESAAEPESARESTPPSSDDPAYMPVSGLFDGERAVNETDVEMTVNLTSDMLGKLPGRDDFEAATQAIGGDDLAEEPLERVRFQQAHLRGALEALIFASDTPLKASELAKRASAALKEVREQLLSLKSEYQSHGIHLEEVNGGWVFRTSPEFAPFVRELSKEKPVRLTRAQLETLAILAYRQPITRPEIDDIRGVDSGPVLKLLLERDLIRILGKKDEAGRPILYGTTAVFLEFFGLKSLKDLPTLTEFTELNEDSRRVVEEELGESLESIQEAVMQKQAALEGAAAGTHEELGLADPDTSETPASHAGGAIASDAEDDGVEIGELEDLDGSPEGADATGEQAMVNIDDLAETHAPRSRDTFTNEASLDENEPATGSAEKSAADAAAEQARLDELEFPDDADDDFDEDDDADDDDDDDDDEDDEADEEAGDEKPKE